MYYQHRNHRENGQAMSEYMTLIPAAVMVAISLSVVAGFLINSLTRVVDSFEPYGNTCEAQQTEEDKGPVVVNVGDHTVSLCAAVYDETSDTTTLTYCVESTCPVSVNLAAGPKGNNGVGNGEDGQPPGSPQVNDGEGTAPGDPGAKGGVGPGNQAEGNAGGFKDDTYELTNIAFDLDLSDEVLAGIKAGEAMLSPDDEVLYTIQDGKLYINYSYADHGLSCDPPKQENDKDSCNNGVGNGGEDCNPGNAPNNDEGEECLPGSPCANDNNNSNNDGEKTNNGKKNASFSAPMSSIVLAAAVDAPTQQEDPYSQEAQGELAGQVNVLISGQYAYAEVNMGIIDRGTIVTTKISAPVRYYDPALDEACAED